MSDHLYEKDVLNNSTYTDVSKSRLDLVVLRHMARKVYLTLKLPEQSATTLQPLTYFSDEHRGRYHRIIIYNREALLNKNLVFVAFISARKQTVSATLMTEMSQTDDQLVTELVNTPGLLGYSSLELRPTNWYNLVLFSDASARALVKESPTHAHGAYQLAPHYYEWVRLHNGVLPKGLAQGDMQLLKTKYLAFQQPLEPIIREYSHET